MRTKRALVVAVLAAAIPVAAAARQLTEGSLDATYEDIRKTLGIVPQFFKAFPERSLPGAWEEMKQLQLNPRTAIPAKYKELIGLAVAAQVPCRYCTYFHTKVANVNGATERERKEAVALAGLTRHWSTVLNGTDMDEKKFRTQTDDILRRAKAQKAQKTTRAKDRPVVRVTDAKSAYRDMQTTLGSVPEFMRRFPEEAIAGAWKTFKSLQLDDQTALKPKYKELIGLAVAAQIPCDYCVYFHTQAARQAGATRREINEAIGMAALTQQWSTVLNGAQMDEETFRAETDRIIQYVKKQPHPKEARR